MIVNDEQRRAMEFIATANRGGYRPTGREINQWRLQPDPKPSRKGKLLEREIPAVPERRVRKGPSPYELALSPILKDQTLFADKFAKQMAAISTRIWPPSP